MKTVQLKEEVTIVKETNLRGIHNCNVKVSSNACLIVNGILNGNIIIEENAEVIVWGMINGDIINKGLCRIVGSIKGLLIENGGQFDIDINATIKN